jgi:hypothetical protein
MLIARSPRRGLSLPVRACVVHISCSQGGSVGKDAPKRSTSPARRQPPDRPAARAPVEPDDG